MKIDERGSEMAEKQNLVIFFGFGNVSRLAPIIHIPFSSRFLMIL